jgi:hypothetical protein
MLEFIKVFIVTVRNPFMIQIMERKLSPMLISVRLRGQKQVIL